MNTSSIRARDLRIGDVMPQPRGGTGTVREIVAQTAKTISVLVEYDDAARLNNGNQATRTNRHSLSTLLQIVRTVK